MINCVAETIITQLHVSLHNVDFIVTLSQSCFFTCKRQSEHFYQSTLKGLKTTATEGNHITCCRIVAQPSLCQ